MKFLKEQLVPSWWPDDVVHYNKMRFHHGYWVIEVDYKLRQHGAEDGKSYVYHFAKQKPNATWIHYWILELESGERYYFEPDDDGTIRRSF